MNRSIIPPACAKHIVQSTAPSTLLAVMPVQQFRRRRLRLRVALPRGSIQLADSLLSLLQQCATPAAAKGRSEGSGMQGCQGVPIGPGLPRVGAAFPAAIMHSRHIILQRPACRPGWRQPHSCCAARPLDISAADAPCCSCQAARPPLHVSHPHQRGGGAAGAPAGLAGSCACAAVVRQGLLLAAPLSTMATRPGGELQLPGAPARAPSASIALLLGPAST
jgi:hypothetical protein